MRSVLVSLAVLTLALPAAAGYVNFEASQVHPIGLTPSVNRLLVINTPDARLEVFLVQPDGSLLAEFSIPVGLEPVSVTARSDTEADPATWASFDRRVSARRRPVGEPGWSCRATRTPESDRPREAASTTSLADATRAGSEARVPDERRSTSWIAPHPG